MKQFLEKTSVRIPGEIYEIISEELVKTIPEQFLEEVLEKLSKEFPKF